MSADACVPGRSEALGDRQVVALAAAGRKVKTSAWREHLERQMPSGQEARIVPSRAMREGRGMTEIVSGISETLFDYCQFVDEARVDDFSGLFTEDAVYDMGLQLEGRASIRKVVSRMLEGWVATSHHVTNIRAREVGAGSAEAMCSVYAWHQRLDGSQYELWGRYVDRLRLEPDGRWRFTERRVQLAGSRGIEGLSVPAVPRRPLSGRPGPSGRTSSAGS